VKKDEDAILQQDEKLVQITIDDGEELADELDAMDVLLRGMIGETCVESILIDMIRTICIILSVQCFERIEKRKPHETPSPE